jgi:lipopolysaccharide transport system ATP-binding protein
MSAIIRVEKVSKLFRLGTLGTGSLRQDVSLWWKKTVLNKTDTLFQSDSVENFSAVNKNYLWALKNVSFDIKEGEVVGFIGRNGAGKSTLLKIMSRIIAPTEGRIRGKGKISSLLEVGTGFHTDLTGRENIYISGHMLGMKKQEILQKFDEIIDFSGIEQFIDTPVKRYSSGMYVRLAFAVAAHLDPDIFIVDEVLAVGDAEFQKKCLGKMKDVSKEKGRTILFVSHNMQAVSNLCHRAIWLEKGTIKSNGNVETVINDYLSAYQQKKWKQEWAIENAPGNESIKVLSVELEPHFTEVSDIIDIRTPITIRLKFLNNLNTKLATSLCLYTLSDECIFDIVTKPSIYEKGIIIGECTIPGNFLNDGSYYFSLFFLNESLATLFGLDECLHFEVEDFREGISYYGKWIGYVRPSFPFVLRPSN